MPTLEYNCREFMEQQRPSESPSLGGRARLANRRNRDGELAELGGLAELRIVTERLCIPCRRSKILFYLD